MKEPYLELTAPDPSKPVAEFREKLTTMLSFWYGPWETFCTWTFKPRDYYDKHGRHHPDREVRLGPATAEREFLRVMKWKQFRSTGYFYVVEPHKFRDAVHVHSLHKAADHIRWSLIHKYWHKEYGRFRSERITTSRTVNYYLTKSIQWSYLTKAIDDGLWNFSKSCQWILAPATLDKFSPEKPPASTGDLFGEN